MRANVKSRVLSRHHSQKAQHAVLLIVLRLQQRERLLPFAASRLKVNELIISIYRELNTHLACVQHWSSRGSTLERC